MTQNHAYKGLQLAQLRSFLLTAQAGNFSAAARTLGLSVATVWQQVRALEGELKVTLLRRRGRVVELTPDGRLLVELVQPHVSGLDSLVPLFQARRVEVPFHLVVASTYYLITHHLPGVVREYLTTHPTVRLSLRPSVWPEAAKRVEDGEAPLGLIPFDPDSVRPAGLHYEHVFDMEFMLLTAADHPLARKRTIQPRDLVEYPMILQPRENFGHQMLERLLRRHDLSSAMQVVVESVSTDTILRYVALGIGVAVIYVNPAVGKSWPGVTLRPVDPTIQGLAVCITTRKGSHLAEPVTSFRDLLRHSLRSLAADGRRS